MLLIAFLAGICGIVFLSIISWYLYVQTFAKYLKYIPGPTPLPVLGNALLFKDSKAILRTLDKLCNNYGNIGRIWIGIEPIIFLADYKAIEKVLSSTKLLEKSQLYKFLHSWLSSGLLTSNGIKWKKRRKMLTPTYHFKILEQFVPIFDKIGNTLVEQMKKDQKKHCFDVYPYIALSALDIICETAMGVPINALKHKESDYVQSVKEMGRIVMERVFSSVQQFDVLYQFTENCRTEKKCLKILHEHTISVIRKRREELSKQKTKTTDSKEDFGERKIMAFLDLLLQTTDNGLPLSDEDICEEVDTFMFAGHDTTASAISFALFEIANHPEVQEKILEETNEIFGKEDREVTYQDISKMKYLEMVIKETLRLYPSVPMIARETLEETQISDDILLPRGTTILVLTYQIHRNPKYYPEPEKFYPERFLPENNLGKNPYSFIPFSAGPRNCIGQKFAYLEMKLIIAKVVRHFQLTSVVPTHQLDLVAESILKSDNGTIIRIEERNK